MTRNQPAKRSFWDFLGPVLFASFIVFLLYTGGVDSVVRFVKEYLGFLGNLLLSCLSSGLIIGSIIYLYDRVEKIYDRLTAQIVITFYVVICIPLVVRIIDAFV